MACRALTSNTPLLTDIRPCDSCRMSSRKLSYRLPNQLRSQSSKFSTAFFWGVKSRAPAHFSLLGLMFSGNGSIPHALDAIVERAALALDDKGRPILDVVPKKLLFTVQPSIVKRIYFAETALCDQMGANDTYVLEFVEYGKQFIVRNKLSPDSVVQMSILLAYYKLYGKIVCRYVPSAGSSPAQATQVSHTPRSRIQLRTGPNKAILPRENRSYAEYHSPGEETLRDLVQWQIHARGEGRGSSSRHQGAFATGARIRRGKRS